MSFFYLCFLFCKVLSLVAHVLITARTIIYGEVTQQSSWEGYKQPYWCILPSQHGSRGRLNSALSGGCFAPAPSLGLCKKDAFEIELGQKDRCLCETKLQQLYFSDTNKQLDFSQKTTRKLTIFTVFFN